VDGLKFTVKISDLPFEPAKIIRPDFYVVAKIFSSFILQNYKGYFSFVSKSITMIEP